MQDEKYLKLFWKCKKGREKNYEIIWAKSKPLNTLFWNKKYKNLSWKCKNRTGNLF